MAQRYFAVSITELKLLLHFRTKKDLEISKVDLSARARALAHVNTKQIGSL